MKTKIRKIISTSTIDFYSADTIMSVNLQLIDGGISAGFPSPADDYIDLSIDLNRELVKNPSATFLGKVKGVSMKDAGIGDQDILVVDKSLEPRDGKIAVCFIDGEFTLKRIKIQKGAVYLMPANDSYQPIRIKEENNFTVNAI